MKQSPVASAFRRISCHPAAASALRATARLAEAKRRREAGPHGVVVVALSLFIASSMVDGMQAALPRTIAKGDQSSIESPAQVLARTEAEWTALWRRHAGAAAVPPVDFTREMVAGVFMGSRPNAGFSITIVTSMEVKGVLVVRYRETIPSRDAVTAQILTFPYHLVAIPKATVTEVKFEKVPSEF